MHPAERRMARAAADVEWLRAYLPRALATLAALTPDGHGSGGTDGPCAAYADDGTRPGPTAAAALGGLTVRDAYIQIDSLVLEAAGVLSQLVTAVEAVPDLGVDTEALWRQHRCSGGEGEWADLTCVRIAVRNQTVTSGQMLPLCWACLKRFQRWRQRAG